MKRRNQLELQLALAVGGGLGLPLIGSSSATAAPVLHANVNISNPFLISNNMFSVSFSVINLGQGESLRGIIGTNEHPFQLLCWDATAFRPFFNVTSDPKTGFDGEGQTAASGAVALPGSVFDSGAYSFLGEMTSPSVNPISFAQFANGHSVVSTDFSWLSTNPGGVVGPNILMFRLTAFNTQGMRVTGVMVVDNGFGTYELPYDFFVNPFTAPLMPPAPGTAALLAMAGLMGGRRRRSA